MRRFYFFLLSLLTMPVAAQVGFPPGDLQPPLPAEEARVSDQLTAQKLKVYFDCYMPVNVVSCDELKMSLFEDTRMVITQDTSADLRISIRVNSLQNTDDYRVTPMWYNQVAPTFSFPLNNTMTANERMKPLLGKLKSVAEPYISTISDATPTTESTEKPFYLSPSASMQTQQQQGSRYFTGSGAATMNYSNPKWRFVGTLGGGFSNSTTNKTPVASGISTKISSLSTGGAVVRRIKDFNNKSQLSFAFFVKDTEVQNNMTIDPLDPNATPQPANFLRNNARKTTIRAGAEWIAVPFRTETSDGNIAVRYSMSGENQKYVSPETYNVVQETFARHLLEVYVTRHYPKLDVSVAGGAFASSFREKQLKGVNGSASINYKINPRMTLTAGGSIQYAKNRVLSPAEGGTTSFSSLTSVQSPLTFNGSITIKYTFGSIRLFNEEQRWKDY